MIWTNTLFLFFSTSSSSRAKWICVLSCVNKSLSGSYIAIVAARAWTGRIVCKLLEFDFKVLIFKLTIGELKLKFKLKTGLFDCPNWDRYFELRRAARPWDHVFLRGVDETRKPRTAADSARQKPFIHFKRILARHKQKGERNRIIIKKGKNLTLLCVRMR